MSILPLDVRYFFILKTLKFTIYLRVINICISFI